MTVTRVGSPKIAAGWWLVELGELELRAGTAGLVFTDGGDKWLVGTPPYDQSLELIVRRSQDLIARADSSDFSRYSFFVILYALPALPPRVCLVREPVVSSDRGDRVSYGLSCVFAF